MNGRDSYKNILNLINNKEDKNSYHSSFSSKSSEKEEKKIEKKINNNSRDKKTKKVEFINDNLNIKDNIKNINFKSLLNNNNKLRKKNKFRTSINLPNDNFKRIKEKEEKKKIKEKLNINKGLLKEQKPIIVDELPKQKYTCFIRSNSKELINKEIKIYIFHREEIFVIQINNGLSINNLIERILEKIKVIKNELELYLFYDIKSYFNSYKNINYYFKNCSINNFEKENKIKKSINELKFLDKNDFDSKNNTKRKILIYPDIDNKFKNIKIRELLKDKYNYFIKANQVSKNKYNSNFMYRNEIKNLSINSFVSNINKEIEKNNMFLTKNNVKALDIERIYENKEKNNNINIKNQYKNKVIVEGISLISDFCNEIKSFITEQEIEDNYNFQNIGIGKYIFGFQKKEIAHDFNKFVNLLQLTNPKFFHIRSKLKIFNSKSNIIHNNTIEKTHDIRKKFFFASKFNNNNVITLKKNLKGPSNSYFLIKGEKKYILNDNDEESMNEIVMMNKYKFKNKNNKNYIDYDNFATIPLI